MYGTIQRFGNTVNADCPKKIFHAFALPIIRYCLPVWGNTSTGCQSSLNRALFKTIRVITNNNFAELNRDSFVATGICYFKRLLSSNNVCRIFNIVRDSSVDYYLNTKMSSDGVVNCTRSATHCKIVPLNPFRIVNGHCFQIATIRDWNDLPFNVTSLTDFNIFKTRYSVILGFS